MEASFPSQDAWTRAKHRYIEDLTDKEKQLYYQATPETLVYDASAAQKKYTSGSTTFAMIEKLQPLREAIDQYGQALDVYSNAYSLFLGPLWGSIRVVLHIAGEFGKYFEKLVEMFTRIGDVLPRFRVYERLFSNHERLVQALSMAYVDIILFCSKCKAILRHGQRSSMTSFKVTFKLTWKPFERQFGQCIEGFRQHRKNVEKEAGLSHMMEVADSRDLVLANQMQLDQQRKEDELRRTLAAIPSVDTEAKHMRLQSLRYHGTCTWLFQDHVYLDWQSADTSSFLCCHGIPGCGKSVLASMVVDVVLSSRDAKVLYYYCDYTDQRTLQINRILGTLLKQSFTGGRIPDEIALQVTQAFRDGSKSLTPQEMMSLVRSAINLNSAVTIILDGLDECEQEAKERMIAFIEGLTNLGSTVVKLFVSCREEDNILRSLRRFARIHVTPAALESDISSFISGSVRSRIEAGQLRLRNPKLEHEIVSELLDKAHGMFLWVFFQLDDLCEAHSDAKIRETLGDLPDGIFETYERILSKITKRKMEDLVSKMFTWIIYAQRPLKVAELQEAVAFDIADKSWDEAKIPHEDLMIESCRSLIVRDKTDNTVRFAHYTVQQYLLHKASTSERSNPSNLVIEGKQQYLGHMCVTYLTFSDFEMQIIPRKPAGALETTGILRSGGPTLIPSVLGVGKSILQLAYRLCGGDPAISAPTVDWTRYLKPRTVGKEELPAEYANKYALLQYVIEFWVFHTKYLDQNTALCYELRNLVCDRTLPFEFRPWGPNRHFGPYGCVSCPDTPATNNAIFSLMSLFHYAAEAGHWPLMEPYAQKYCAHERYTDETLVLACRYDQVSIVEKLLKIHKYDKTSSRALNVAAALGHASVLKHLLMVGKTEPGTYKRVLLDEALILAATNGHEEAVGLLIEKIIAIGSMSKEAGRTALSIAARNGHERVVQTLLNKGVRRMVEHHEWGQPSPLCCAAENGHVTIVRALLDASIRQVQGQTLINEVDEYWTPALCKAATKGHVSVVETLLKYGANSMMPGGHAAIESAADAGHEDVVNVLLVRGECLPHFVHKIAPDKHEEMLRRLLESNWKHLTRSTVEYTLNFMPESDIKYHARMTALLRSTLAKIDTEAQETETALGEMHSSNDEENLNSLGTNWNW